MAEGFVVHFLASDWPEVCSTLNLPKTECQSIPLGDDYLVTVSESRAGFEAYSSEQRSLLLARLGGEPTCSMSVELRRSRQTAAVPFVQKLLTSLAANHDLLVDDEMWEPFDASLWTSEDILGSVRRNGLHFLENYV